MYAHQKITTSPMHKIIFDGRLSIIFISFQEFGDTQLNSQLDIDPLAG
jgi:hypothetical protein